MDNFTDFAAVTNQLQVQLSEGAEYLRSLRDVPPLLQVAAGGGASVEGKLDIDEDAKLLPMGTFPTSRMAAIDLRRKVQKEGYSAAETVSISSSKEELWGKVSDLTKEIEWLKTQLGELQEVEAENMALKVQAARSSALPAESRRRSTSLV